MSWHTSSPAIVEAVETLVGMNELFRRRLMRVDGFGATGDGKPGVIASTMTGLKPVLYQSGRVLALAGKHQVGDLFVMGETPLPLAPFVVCLGDDVYFLSEYRKGTPVLWCPNKERHIESGDRVKAIDELLPDTAGNAPSFLDEAPTVVMAEAATVLMTEAPTIVMTSKRRPNRSVRLDPHRILPIVIAAAVLAFLALLAVVLLLLFR